MFRLTACLDDVYVVLGTPSYCAHRTADGAPPPEVKIDRASGARPRSGAAPGDLCVAGAPTALELELRFVGPFFLSGARAKSGEALVGVRRM